MNPRRTLFATYFGEYTPPGLCHAEGDGSDGAGGAGTNGAGGGNGAGNGAGDGSTQPNSTATPAPDWNQFISGLDTLNSQLGGKLDNLIGTVQQASATSGPEPAAPVDFDGMTNSELQAHIVGSVTRAVETMLSEKLAPLTAAIDNTQRTMTTQTVTAEIAALRGAHKDFNDWMSEMKALATEQPSLGIGDIYSLVRARNPAKAGELDRRYNPPAAKPLPFGGFTPGSAGKPGAPAVLDALTAGRQAYSEVSARHPGVLAALQDS